VGREERAGGAVLHAKFPPGCLAILPVLQQFIIACDFWLFHFSGFVDGI